MLRLMRLKREREKERESKEERKKERAKAKLKGFFKKNIGTLKHKIRTQFLKSICTDSGVCIAFGKEKDKIDKFFDNFVDFKYAVSRKKIGETSLNGFVYEITYERDGYFAHAVLKSSTNAKSDNLSYEFFVGTMINKNFIKKLPCFVETYGLFTYGHRGAYEAMQNQTSSQKLNEFLNYQPYSQSTGSRLSIRRACENSQFLCVLTQNIKGAKTMKGMLNSVSMKDFVERDLASCLYQIYFALVATQNVFTHYDLHYGNVLLFEPVKDKYIQFTYENNAVSFKSKYIVKIIDYGRSYIKDPATGEDSMSVYQKVCAEPKCVTTCGNKVGYPWLNPTPNAEHINSSRKNISKDLWLLDIINGITRVTDRCPPLLRKLIRKITYFKYNGAENLTTGYPNEINNVMDAEACLRQYLQNADEIAGNDAHYDAAPYSKLGDLHIRVGHDMVYTPAPR